MWLLPVTRRELVDLITPRRGSDVPGVVKEHRPVFDTVHSDMMAAVWPAPPAEFGRMPTVIVVREGMRRDTLAWLSTYVRDFRPFTAFCRVVERPVAEQFLRGSTAPNLLGIEGVCAGLILGEALTHAKGRALILDLPTTAYSATLSQAISRTLALTDGAFPVEGVVTLWDQARDLTGQNGLGVSPKLILSVWAIALGVPAHGARSRTLFESTDILSAAWADLSSAGEIRDPVWRRLIEGLPDLDPMRKLIDVPREQRVQAVDAALRVLLSSKGSDDDRHGFLAGYFTSLLGPGTLDHADFLPPVAATLPTAYLWYGLFAGVNPRGDAIPVGNPLARRIVRDLLLPDRLIDRPRCDVALDELAMHGAVENLLRQTARAGRLDIDLLPGVTTSVRWPPYEVSGEEEIRRDRNREAQHLLAQMDEVTTHTRHLMERLRDALRMDYGDRQQVSKRKRGTKT